MLWMNIVLWTFSEDRAKKEKGREREKERERKS